MSKLPFSAQNMKDQWLEHMWVALTSSQISRAYPLEVRSNFKKADFEPFWHVFSQYVGLWLFLHHMEYKITYDSEDVKIS